MNGPPCLEVTQLGFEFPLAETDVHKEEACHILYNWSLLFILSFFLHTHFSFSFYTIHVLKKE